MQEEKHYIDSIYYQLELTAKYCKYLGSQLIEKVGMSLSLDEVVTLDTLATNGEMCQRDLAKIILKTGTMLLSFFACGRGRAVDFIFSHFLFLWFYHRKTDQRKILSNYGR